MTDEIGDTGGHLSDDRPLLQVEGVTLQYRTREHRVTATYRVSFDIERGDRFVLLGPSGCGKSTLLKSIAGFMKPAEGRISLDGLPVVRPGPDRMMVFQEFDQLLPWKTVRQNVTYPMRCNGVSAAEADARAVDILEKVHLSKFVDAYPHALSGGMKQRVAIARAMAMRPKVLLMDEPYAALDALTRRRMQEELLELWQNVGFTLIFVTHSIEEAVLIGNRVLVLSPHPGQVRAELDAGGFDAASQTTPEFQALCRRIHAMLFDPECHEGAVPKETAA
ncbi:ABC transporter ATP-binding protein [uncultured Methylobacterium sp.]|uniref:ABC transporter ATP-binding protein n=1 Tax=uncultured Methylobacterium sp. TaxID=157278 RepID=UPI0025943BC0|nr:ABC transporter ATP-binding protein [uncultured Methylobacterium sp.]